MRFFGFGCYCCGYGGSSCGTFAAECAVGLDSYGGYWPAGFRWWDCAAGDFELHLIAVVIDGRVAFDYYVAGDWIGG